MSNSNEFIKVFSEKTLRSLTKLEQSQHPFVFAKALTLVAEGSAEKVRKRMRLAYDLKTEFIPKGVRRTMAKKSDIKSKGKASSVVFTMDKIGFMGTHEDGSTRTPHSGGRDDKGRSIAIPGKEFLNKFYTKSGRTKKTFKPQTLLTNFSRTKGTKRGAYSGTRRRLAFVVRSKKKGTPMIVRRRTQKRLPLEVLYVFSKKAKFKPTLNM